MLESTFHIASGLRSYNVRIARTGGHLDHYYHFVMDLVWPLHHWLKSMQVEGGAVRTREERALYFASHFQAMLGRDLRSADRFTKAIDRVGLSRPVELLGFNSRVRDYARMFNDNAGFQRSRLDLVTTVRGNLGLKESDGGDPQVILIERVEVVDHRGATRRSIPGHVVLRQRLERLCADHQVTFRSIRLEELSFKEQFALMRQGPTILIGQHGAGLLNGIWMEHAQSMVIELAAEDNPSHFQNLFIDQGMNYRRIVQAAEGAYGQQQRLLVDPEQVASEVGTIIAAIRNSER